jgi:hypothetical protein
MLLGPAAELAAIVGRLRAELDIEPQGRLVEQVAGGDSHLRCVDPAKAAA